MPSSGVCIYEPFDALPAAGEPAPEDFSPVMRFAVASDVHIRDAAVNDLCSHAMLDALLEAVYDYADAQSGYTGLDGLFFTGDNTQTASEAEQLYFFDTVRAALRDGTVMRAVMGNHEFFGTGRYTEESFIQAPLNFIEYSGYDAANAHFLLGGYDFIFLSNDVYAPGAAFSEEKLAWLQSELDAAAARDETGRKPIFLFQHEPPEGAVGGAVTYASDSALAKLLSAYPQVVDFSGHTHFPMTGPYSVWQKDYTAVALGSLCFSLVPIVNHPVYGDIGVFGDIAYEDYPGICPFDRKGGWMGVTEACPRSAELFCFVETDAQARIRIVVYDALSKTAVGEPLWIGRVGDPSEFNLTAARSYTATRPSFAEDAQIRVLSHGATVVRIAVPQAQNVSDPVQNYRADLYKNGVFVDSFYALSDDFFGPDMPDEVFFGFSSLDASANYTVKVYAVSYWGLCSEPLCVSLKTKSKNAVSILSTAFTPDEGVYNRIDGVTLSTQGEPKVCYDAQAERYVAALDGQSCYVFEDLRTWLDVLSGGMSLELVVKIDAYPDETVNLFSAMEYGGFGFSLKADGTVEFLYDADDSYFRASGSLPLGEYVHLVGTYNGSRVYLYINGVLAGSKAVTGSFTAPKEYAQKLCLGGDPTTGGLMSKFMTGSVMEAGLYSRALSAAEVRAHNEEWRAVKEIDKDHAHVYENGFCVICGEPEPPRDPYDINGDGSVTVEDVSRLLDLLAGVFEAPDPMPDLDADGGVSVSDVSALLDRLAIQAA